MRVYRGRADTIDGDRAVSERLVERVAADREPAVRVWRPHRQVAFGRRDARAEGYDRARELADERGFPPVEREVGGRAVAYTGSTVAFARVTPVTDSRSGLQDRYDAAAADLLDALGSLGVDAREGEPPDSFCPGTHSVRADCGGRPRKLAGLAQRVRADAAVVAGVLVVRDHGAIASVLDPVYRALDVSFDPETVGSVARADGRADPDAVVDAVEGALVDEAAGDTSVQRVG
ncbi:lipoate--protein ligase family protein [Halosimplex pelagicum]|uniref:Lipoate--protein ligase family protein n=1 Tax=Halosimplex pelagicum TaxID=869886 RepID=A0A7D5P5R7_9EURY|nr:lipoate--protein ligase family protein [Halosimplex pelagicum]QLH81503.1 lipoate--protein ligase family protein [Halosimplex pelagicum]